MRAFPILLAKSLRTRLETAHGADTIVAVSASATVEEWIRSVGRASLKRDDWL
jgi:hypothetical protein